MIKQLLAASAVLFAATVCAQAPEEPRGRGDDPPRVFGGPPGFRLGVALDANADGKISATEIRDATAALKELDKDNDGKLSGEEIGWPPSFFGGGFPGFGPPPRGGPPGGGRGGRGGFGGGFGGPSGRGPARRPDPDTESSPARSSPTATNERPPRGRPLSASQLKSTDRNQDGIITKEEIPRLIRESILDRVDTNKDGQIDQSELDALAGRPAEPQ
jgi:hypothetical protein